MSKNGNPKVSSVRYRKKTRLRGKGIIALLSIAATAMAADQNAPFRPRPAEEYGAKSTFDQMTIAIEPFDTEEETKLVFKKLHPPRYGVLPVLVVIENNRKDAIDARGLIVRYKARGENEIEATPSQEVRYAGSGPTKPRINQPLPVPIPPRSKKNPLSDTVIDERAFAAKMIAPGESAWGFVYFQTEYHGGATIIVSGLRDAPTAQELFFVEIPVTHR